MIETEKTAPHIEAKLQQIASVRESPSNFIVLPIIGYCFVMIFLWASPMLIDEFLIHGFFRDIGVVSFLTLTFAGLALWFVQMVRAMVRFSASFADAIAKFITPQLHEGEKLLSIQTGGNMSLKYAELKLFGISPLASLIFTTQRVIVIQYFWSVPNVKRLKKIAKANKLDDHIYSISWIYFTNKNDFVLARYAVLNPIFFTSSILTLQLGSVVESSWLLHGRFMRSGALLRKIQGVINASFSIH